MLGGGGIIKKVLKYFDWAYRNGGAMATELDCIAITNKNSEKKLTNVA